MKITAFGASHSQHSINRKLAAFVAAQFPLAQIEVLDLNDFKLPLFTVDVEAETGIPEAVHRFKKTLDSADLIVVSMAEHNGSYTASFKNLFDWTSRLKSDFLRDKKVFLMATSNGARGGASVMQAAADRFPRHGADIVAQFSLPEFDKNFEEGKGITHTEIMAQLNELIDEVKQKIQTNSNN